MNCHTLFQLNTYIFQAPSPDMYRGVACDSEQPGIDFALHVKKLIDDIKSNKKQVGYN